MIDRPQANQCGPIVAITKCTKGEGKPVAVSACREQVKLNDELGRSSPDKPSLPALMGKKNPPYE